MIYLSRLVLNPRHRGAQRDLADCQQLHRTIMSAFPQIPQGVTDARHHFGVLYRVEDRALSIATTDDDGEIQAGIVVLVQSNTPPSWGHLPPAYLKLGSDSPEGRGLPNPALKSLHAIYDSLHVEQTLVFRLRANPTRKIETRTGSDGRRRNGRRVEIASDQGVQEWLHRKGQASGFRVLSVRTDARSGKSVPDVCAGAMNKVVGRSATRSVSVGTMPSADVRQLQPTVLTFGSVLFDGHLRITDIDLFCATLAKGIGSGKAYGFGLLSIAPARSSD